MGGDWSDGFPGKSICRGPGFGKITTIYNSGLGAYSSDPLHTKHAHDIQNAQTHMIKIKKKKNFNLKKKLQDGQN